MENDGRRIILGKSSSGMRQLGRGKTEIGPRLSAGDGNAGGRGASSGGGGGGGGLGGGAPAATAVPPVPAAGGADNTRSAREQEQHMPVANVLRIMRKVLPTHAKISEEAKEAVQSYVSMFISHITADANERCRQEMRKTVTAEDVLFALGKLGFTEYAEKLTVYLQAYREAEGEHRPARRDVLYPSVPPTGTAPPPDLYQATGLGMAPQGYPAAGFYSDDAGSSGITNTAAAMARGRVPKMPKDHQRDV